MRALCGASRAVGPGVRALLLPGAPAHIWGWSGESPVGAQCRSGLGKVPGVGGQAPLFELLCLCFWGPHIWAPLQGPAGSPAPQLIHSFVRKCPRVSLFSVVSVGKKVQLATVRGGCYCKATPVWGGSCVCWFSSEQQVPRVLRPRPSGSGASAKLLCPGLRLRSLREERAGRGRAWTGCLLPGWGRGDLHHRPAVRSPGQRRGGGDPDLHQRPRGQERRGVLREGHLPVGEPPAVLACPPLRSDRLVRANSGSSSPADLHGLLVRAEGPPSRAPRPPASWGGGLGAQKHEAPLRCTRAGVAACDVSICFIVRCIL